jgi:hypothetical protein
VRPYYRYARITQGVGHSKGKRLLRANKNMGNSVLFAGSHNSAGVQGINIRQIRGQFACPGVSRRRE